MVSRLCLAAVLCWAATHKSSGEEQRGWAGFLGVLRGWAWRFVFTHWPKNSKLTARSWSISARAGIHDKGSALASMTDEEVAKLKEFIAGKSRPAERPAAPAGSGSRGSEGRGPAIKPTVGKPPLTRASGGPAPIKLSGKASVTDSLPYAEGSSPAGAAPGQTGAAAALKREDYIAPAGVVVRGRVADISQPKPGESRPAGPRSGGDGPRPVPRPAFKLSPLPAASRPPVSRGPQEPVAQKPDVKLPLDAIRKREGGRLEAVGRPHAQARAASGRRRSFTLCCGHWAAGWHSRGAWNDARAASDGAGRSAAANAIQGSARRE